MKYLCNVSYRHFSIAGIDDSSTIDDFPHSCYAFTVFGVEPQEFIDLLEEVYLLNQIDMQDNDDFPGERVLNKQYPSDTIRATFDYNRISITRGNFKCLYNGNFHNLYGCVSELKKVIKDFEIKNKKEDKLWSEE